MDSDGEAGPRSRRRHKFKDHRKAHYKMKQAIERYAGPQCCAGLIRQAQLQPWALQLALGSRRGGSRIWLCVQGQRASFPESQ